MTYQVKAIIFPHVVSGDISDLNYWKRKEILAEKSLFLILILKIFLNKSFYQASCIVGESYSSSSIYIIFPKNSVLSEH